MKDRDNKWIKENGGLVAIIALIISIFSFIFLMQENLRENEALSLIYEINGIGSGPGGAPACVKLDKDAEELSDIFSYWNFEIRVNQGKINSIDLIEYEIDNSAIRITPIAVPKSRWFGLFPRQQKIVAEDFYEAVEDYDIGKITPLYDSIYEETRATQEATRYMFVFLEAENGESSLDMIKQTLYIFSEDEDLILELPSSMSEIDLVVSQELRDLMLNTQLDVEVDSNNEIISYETFENRSRLECEKVYESLLERINEYRSKQ